MAVRKKDATEEKMLLVRIPKELHRQVRLLSVELDISTAELCKEALEMILEKYRKKQEAKGKK